MNAFEKGFEYVAENMGALSGGVQGEEYIANINNEINKLCSELNKYAGNGLTDERLAGFMAEHWHAGTYNINAAIKGSTSRANVEGLNTLGSVDISLNNSDYSSKYLRTARTTAEAQSTSINQKYMEYLSKAEKSGETPLSLKQFLEKKQYDGEAVGNNSLYVGQFRLVPHDQMNEIIDILNKKIAKESVTRPEVAERYKEVLKNITDRVSDGKAESIPLTREEAILCAKSAKEGGVESESLGLTTENLVTIEDILHDSVKAGVSAAVITTVLKIAPEIYQILVYLIQTGELDVDHLKDTGVLALKTAPEAFLRGSISAAIVGVCQAGFVSESLKNVEPSHVAACVVLGMEVLKDSFLVATGKITATEMVDHLMRGAVSTVCSIALGTAMSGIPVVGYFLGSFLGGILGNLAYSTTTSVCMSLCVKHGWTMFGIVEQNYQMPIELLKEIGIDVFEYEKVDYRRMEHKVFEHQKFEYQEFEPVTLDITVLRRGVIGVRSVGYL